MASRRLQMAMAAMALGSAQAATLSHDAAQRLTMPVMVDGKGPYDFVIDTGADRSVISRELAALLGLPSGPSVVVHNTGGASVVPTALIERLGFGDREVQGVEAPVLSARDLGAMGMLGIDCLRGQRVVLDFRAGTFATEPSVAAEDFSGLDTITVYGRRRFGHLVLVDSESHGTPIFVILDTGAQNSLGNEALRRLVSAPPPAGHPTADVISVTGSHTPGYAREISEIRLGGVSLQHVPVAYADIETFRQFGLETRPAMLLGMDVLRLFHAVAIDFPRRQAVFVAQ